MSSTMSRCLCAQVTGSVLPSQASQTLPVLVLLRSLTASRSSQLAQPQPQPQQESASASSNEQAHQGGAAEASSSSGSTSQDDFGQRVVEGIKAGFQQAKSGYEEVKSKVGSQAGGARPQPPLLKAVMHEFQTVLLPNQNVTSVTRQYTGPVMEVGPSGSYEGPTALVVAQEQKSTWQQALDSLGLGSLLGRLRGVDVSKSTAYKKGAELVEDLRERYETSDHPMVHKVEEVKSRVFTGSEASRAMREIRARCPAYDMNSFVQSIKLDAPLVTKAVLKHDLETLRLHCGPELMQRFEGIFKHYREQELYDDPTILFVGDVEVVEVKLLEDDPFVIIQFHCQQLKCTRDKFGNVVEGSADTIQRVYYFWGLQQERESVVTAEGTVLPPRWVIRDMMWQSMLALV